MMATRVTWRGDREVKARMNAYADRMRQAVLAVAEYWAPVLEAYAKEHAGWTDRTGNARQSLEGFVEELSRDTVAIFLTHGMEYGLFLETRFQARYAIILPTLEAHYEPIRRMLREIFR